MSCCSMVRDVDCGRGREGGGGPVRGEVARDVDCCSCCSDGVRDWVMSSCYVGRREGRRGGVLLFRGEGWWEKEGGVLLFRGVDCGRGRKGGG